MVLVPGGTYVIGRDDGDEYERPRHSVTLKAFLIDRHEVTVADYAKFVAATGRTPPLSWAGGTPPAGADQLPVTGVNWIDASAYAAWVGKRLPTEQEWEAAARGPNGFRYPWGDAWRDGAANAAGARGDLAQAGSHPSGASPSGALDMVGNAWEWTASEPTAYAGGAFPTTPRQGSMVMRGGCFKSGNHQATTTFRAWAPKTGGEYGNVGFRCARDAP